MASIYRVQLQIYTGDWKNIQAELSKIIKQYYLPLNMRLFEVTIKASNIGEDVIQDYKQCDQDDDDDDAKQHHTNPEIQKQR